jgi:hypothetical protein
VEAFLAAGFQVGAKTLAFAALVARRVWYTFAFSVADVTVGTIVLTIAIAWLAFRRQFAFLA